MEAVGDFHIHTKYCGHARGEMEEYVIRACELGLPKMGFAAHFPADTPHRDKVSLSPGDVEPYVNEAYRLRDAFKGQIDILMGFEADYFEGDEKRIEKECIERWKPDYVMGSIHIIGDWPFDHPDYIDGYAEWRITDLYRTYFGMLEKLAGSGLFHTLAHMDLVKKFGYRPEDDVSDAFCRVLDAVAENDMLIEINTSGLDRPVGEMYPSPDILRAAADRNIGITLGSDSHAPEEVGRHFADALELLRGLGCDRVAHSGCLPFYTRG